MLVRPEVESSPLRPFRPNCCLYSQTRDCARAFAGGVVGLVFLLSIAGCEPKPEAPKPMPPEVEVTEVVQQTVPIYNEWVSLLNGPVNADITPKVQGYLLKQDYQNGFFVKKGQLLYDIDPRPFVAALDQAKAEVAAAVANQGEWENNVARDTPLAAQHAIPQKQLDTDTSTLEAAKAQVLAYQANQVQAELNLQWTKVYSPIDGVAGNSNSQVGDLVGTTTKMTTISQVNPIWAYFNISEADYLSNAEAISTFVMSGKRTKNIPVEFVQANAEPFPQKGEIVLVSREITSQTGTIQLAAAFP